MGVRVCRRAHKVVHPDAEDGCEDAAKAHDEGDEACQTKVNIQGDVERGKDDAPPYEPAMVGSNRATSMATMFSRSARA